MINIDIEQDAFDSSIYIITVNRYSDKIKFTIHEDEYLSQVLMKIKQINGGKSE